MFEDINGRSLDADVIYTKKKLLLLHELLRANREIKKEKRERERETKKQTPPITFQPTLLDNIIPRAPIHTTAINILNASLVYAARVPDPRSVLKERKAGRSGRHESFVPPESPRVITVYYGGSTTGFACS